MKVVEECTRLTPRLQWLSFFYILVLLGYTTCLAQNPIVTGAPAGNQLTTWASGSSLTGSGALTTDANGDLFVNGLSPWADVKAFGAKGNEQENTGASMASGSSTLTTTASPTFASTDCQGGSGCTGTNGNKSIAIPNFPFPVSSTSISSAITTASGGSGNITGPTVVYIIWTCTDGNTAGGATHIGQPSLEATAIFASGTMNYITVGSPTLIACQSPSAKYSVWASQDSPSATLTTSPQGVASGHETLQSSCTDVAVSSTCTLNSISTTGTALSSISWGVSYGTITSFNTANSVGVSFLAPSPNGITVAKVSWATDDTAAIQNAINKACPSGSNTGGAVFFPPGSYWVNTSSGPGLSINNQPFCFLYAEGIAATPVIGLPGGYPGNPPVGSQNNKPAAAAELVDPSVNEIIKTGNGSGESFKGIGFAHLGFRDLTECLASGAIHFVRQDRVFMLNVSVLDFCALHNDGYNIANVPATQPASAYTPRGYAVFFDQSGGSCVAGSACANYSQFEDLYNLSLVNDTNGIVSGNGRISRLNVHNAEIIGARAGGGRAITEQPNYSTDAGSPNLFQDVESNYFPVAEQIADCQGCKVVHSHHENSDSLSDVGSAGVGTTLWLEDSGGNKCISDAIDELDSSSPYMHVQIDAGCRNIQVGFIQATAGTILVKDDNVVNPGNYTSTWNGESSTQYSSSSDYVTKRINGSANYTVGDLACPSSTANSVTLCAINIDADQILGIMVASISTLNGSSANIMTTAGRGVVVTLDGTGGAASANNWVCTGSTAGVGTVSTSRCTPGKQIGILQTSVLANAASALIWFLPDRTPAQTVLGPLSATAGNLAAFNGTSGTLLQDSTLPSSKVVVPANVWFKATAPTISSGFGTSPSISVNNGTGAFVVNVGTGGTATSGVIGLPTASHGWVCIAQDTTTQSATVFITKQTAFSTTSCTIGNFNTSGAAAAWASGDNVVVSAFGI